MLTTVKTRTSLDTKDWVKLFPAKVECYSSSFKFMTQLTTIAVSTITYLKCMFPDGNYLTEEFNGIELKILKYKCENIEAQFISQALLNAFDAIGKKYLKKMALCFYKNSDCTLKNLIESFWFEFNYTDNAVSMHTKNPNNQEIKKCMSLDDIQFATIKMIRCCIVVSQCGQKLPENFDLAIRLYYNDDAPMDYQAPGYESGLDDNLFELTDKLIVGVVKTPFHELVLWNCYNDVQHSTNEAIPSNTAPQWTQDSTEHHSKTVDERAKSVVKCPCNNYNDPQRSSLEMLRCTFCNTLQHAVCFGLVSNIQRHCCCVCSDEDQSRVPTDKKLAVCVTAKYRQTLCMYRRVLWWCHSSSKCRISGTELIEHFSIGEANAVKLLKLLQKDNVIDAPNDVGISQPRQILFDGLRSVLEEYFKDLSENYSDLTLKLMSDCMSSTTTEHPIAEVVESFQEVSLNESSSVQNNDDDELKKRFREAILKFDTIPKKLPLSGSHNPVQNFDEIMQEKKSMKRKTAVNGNEKCDVNSKKLKRATKK